MICQGCGCSDFDACVDQETGLTCSWASVNPPVCSFCAELAAQMHERIEGGMLRPDGDEPLIGVYSERDAQRYIEERRAIGGGA